MMKFFLAILFLLCNSFGRLHAQAPDYAAALATTAMKIWPDSFLLEGDKVAKWRYDQGVVLKGVEGLWRRTGEGKWFSYIQKSMDFYVGDNGSIRGYRPDEYNIDHINNGKLLLMLYQVTGKDKYRKAAALLRQQLLTHPRTSAGGFWHKKIYPNQMWLDGLYMAQPFYAEWARVFGEDSIFNDVTRQFVLMEQAALNPETGLLHHGWDESREQRWADKSTGRSPHVWGRALGWYGMALVDALEHFPQDHPGRVKLTGILNRFASAAVKLQDDATGLWYDIPDQVATSPNYPEASASAMLVYTLAKGVRKGYLPSSFMLPAQQGWQGVLDRFVKWEGGQANLHGTVAVSGLGGNPYRDGSFVYYMSEPVVVNDPKGMGAFINAANEMALHRVAKAPKPTAVVLDYYFNNEYRNTSDGRRERFHYTWEDRSNSGFSILGDIIESRNGKLQELKEAPCKKNLKGAGVYIIVDPDTEAETDQLNPLLPAHVKAVNKWVKKGGVLLLMGNDAGNVNLQSMNRLGAAFGVHFNADNFNTVEANKFEQGLVKAPASELFKKNYNLFIKELATLRTSAPARPVVWKDGKEIIAVSSFGKGWVVAIGDPWLYNEYVDGRKLPESFDNYAAAHDLVDWLLKRAAAK